MLVHGRSVPTSAVGIVAALVLPFSRDPAFLVHLYAKTLGSYPYATLNAAMMITSSAHANRSPHNAPVRRSGAGTRYGRHK